MFAILLAYQIRLLETALISHRRYTLVSNTRTVER